MVATGITADGGREILGLDVGDSEDEVFWRGFLTALKQRGLAGVRLVISDQHAGLVAALQPLLPGRGAPALPGPLRPQPARPRAQGAQADMVAAVFRTIFAQPDPTAVAATWDQVRDQLADRFPKIGPLMDDAKAEVLAFTAFPRAHWRKIWSHQPARAGQQGDQAPRPRRRASSPTTPPSSASSAPSWPTCTTNGKPATAATSPKAPWRKLYTDRDTDTIAAIDSGE